MRETAKQHVHQAKQLLGNASDLDAKAIGGRGIFSHVIQRVSSPRARSRACYLTSWLTQAGECHPGAREAGAFAGLSERRPILI